MDRFEDIIQVMKDSQEKIIEFVEDPIKLVKDLIEVVKDSMEVV